MRRVRTTGPIPAPRSFVESLGEPDRRDDDLRLLRALSESGDVPERHQDAFDDMLVRLLSTGQKQLTEGQRAYAESIAGELGIDPRDPAEKNRDVPKGRDVETPAALSTGSVQKALDAMRSRRERTRG